jgi:hypothetical protein
LLFLQHPPNLNSETKKGKVGKKEKLNRNLVRVKSLGICHIGLPVSAVMAASKRSKVHPTTHAAVAFLCPFGRLRSHSFINCGHINTNSRDRLCGLVCDGGVLRFLGAHPAVFGGRFWGATLVVFFFF